MIDAQKRLAALSEYEIMDTPSEPMFDELTRLTSVICGTPIALVTLLDTRRQWFKSRVGLEASETPIDQAFCAHAIEQDHVFLVPDATLDRRFSSNPLVTGDPHIRFYAGAPLITPDGTALGTLCAIDRVPRELSAWQQGALADLSNQVVRMLELRRTNQALRLALAEKQAAQREVGLLQEIIPMCAWCRKLRDDRHFWSQVEDYFHAHSGTRFTHGICPECLSKAQGDESSKS